MINELFDGLASSVGFGRSIMERRGRKLSLPRQMVGYALGILFFAAISILLILNLGTWLKESFSRWLLLPIGIVFFYLLFELGLWCGIVLAEIGHKIDATKDSKRGITKT